MFGLLALAPSASAVGGNVVGWGFNDVGQVGPAPETVTTPALMPGLANVTGLGVGAYHAYAVLADGTARGWGFNREGQLGNGTTDDTDTPVPLSGLSNVVAIDGGTYHGVALLGDGSVYTFGENSHGQLGLGSVDGPEICGADTCSRVPRAVPGLAGVVAIAAAHHTSFAVLENGTVMAWGDDQYGELGDGVGNDMGCECTPYPVPVPGVAGAVAVDGGYNTVAALLADGTVRSWGAGDWGQLGNGALAESSPCYCFGPVPPVGVTAATDVAVGSSHQLVAIAGGGVRAWGRNDVGQLGIGGTTAGGCQCIPTQVIPLVNGVEDVVATDLAGIALLGDGTALSWGKGESGELGGGAVSERPSPGAVTGLAGASAIAAGEYNGFAIIGPSQTLSVSLAGAGSGTVGGGGLHCPPACSKKAAQGSDQVLRAQPAPGTGFAGFTGACTGTGPCLVALDTDMTVTATFGPPKGTAITKAKVQHNKKRVTFDFTAPGAVTGYQCRLIKPKPKKAKRKGKPKQKAVTSAKGKRTKPKPPKFSACATPKLYRNLRPGSYRFEVRALNSLGADPKPASKKVKLKAVRKQKRKKQARG